MWVRPPPAPADRRCASREFRESRAQMRGPRVVDRPTRGQGLCMPTRQSLLTLASPPACLAPRPGPIEPSPPGECSASPAPASSASSSWPRPTRCSSTSSPGARSSTMRRRSGRRSMPPSSGPGFSRAAWPPRWSSSGRGHGARRAILPLPLPLATTLLGATHPSRPLPMALHTDVGMARRVRRRAGARDRVLAPA
jgi:hypothetical protein